MVKNRHLGSVWAIFKAKIIFIRFGAIFKIFEILKFFPAKILKIWHFWPPNFQSWPISGQKILKMCLSKSYLFPNKNAGDRSEKLWMCSKNSENSHFPHFLTWTGSRGFPLCPTEFHFVLQIFTKFKISAFAQYITQNGNQGGLHGLTDFSKKKFWFSISERPNGPSDPKIYFWIA